MASPRVVERRIVTVLFADLVGFTSLSERLDAEDVAAVQDAYFDAVRASINRHGGVLEKFVGDAAMAVFGAPRVRDDDAERAVHAALSVIAAVERLAAQIGLDEGDLRLRIGINTGEAIYGDATAERGPVTGDTVNVAARLQAAAEPGSVVVGELTALAVAHAVVIEPIEPLELKGKSSRVRAFRVAGIHAEHSRERALGDLRAPILGRDLLIDRILTAVDDAPHLLALVAPPGIGKTRLLDEVARRLPAGTGLLRCRARPEIVSPFEPLGQLVTFGVGAADLVGLLERRGLASNRARVVAAELEALMVPAVEPEASRRERDEMFDAWLTGLDALGGDHCVWLVEDVHWASPDLLAFLEEAGRRGGARRLVVATARPSIRETAAGWCERAELVELPPLDGPFARDLVRALVDDSLPPDVVDRIAEASSGNALFVEELLRTWVIGGVLVRDGGRWSLTLEQREIAIPTTVQAIYAGQLDDLPMAARTGARRASVAGRRFPLASLRALGVDDAAGAIASLARRELIAGPIADEALGDSYVFRHALLRDAAYATLARRDRADLHSRLADWLTSHAEAATVAEVVARHYAAAVACAPALAREIGGRTRDEISALAANWFELASTVASSFAAWSSAYELARRALELTPADDAPGRAGRLERVGVTAFDALGADEAEPPLRAALEAYRALGSGFARGLASTTAALGDVLRARTRFQEAAELAEEALAEVGDADPEAVARLLLLRGLAVLNAWDAYDAAGLDARRAAELASRADDPVLQFEALQLLAQVEAEQGIVDNERWSMIERLAREQGRWQDVAAAIRTRAGLAVDDDPQHALVSLEAADEVAAAHGLAHAAAWCDYLRTEAYFVAGSWDDALSTGLHAIERGEALGHHRVVVRTWFALLPIAEERGRIDLLRRAFERFDARKGSEPDSHYARVIATAAHLRFADADLEAFAVPDVESRLPSFRLAHAGPSWLAAILRLVDAWLAEGERAGVAHALDEMHASLDHSPAPSNLARATEMLARTRLAAASLDRTATVASALQVLEMTEAPWWRLKAIELLTQTETTETLMREAHQLRIRLDLDGERSQRISPR